MKNRVSKSKKLFALLLAVALIICSMPMSAIAVGADEGTFKEIRTIEDLYNVRDDLTANYKLMNDIDLTEATAKGGDWDFDGRGWNPIGSNDVYGNGEFSGIFDGNGHKIIGMRIDIQSFSGSGKTCAGLFASISGTVKNLELSDIYIYSHNIGSTGSISGNANNATIIDCKSSGYIRGYYNVGGLIGYFSGNAENLTSRVDVVGGAYVGGIFGYCENSTINKVFNSGSVVAKKSISSLYTSNKNGGNYYNYGSGICGYAVSTSISNSYNTQNVTVESKVSDGYTSYSPYACGIACGANCNGCYNIGTIQVSTSNIYSGYSVGTGTHTNCYYLNGSGNSYSGTTSLTPAQLKTQSMYRGFDFDNVWVLDTEAVYSYPQLRENPQDIRKFLSLTFNSMPEKTVYEIGDELDLTGLQLKAQFDEETVIVDVTHDMVTGFDNTKLGNQTITVTYIGKTVSYDITINEKTIVYKEIRTIEELYNIRNDLTANYKLMNDIDLTAATAKGGDWDFYGNGWNPIGSNDVYGSGEFSGIFNGNGYSIKGMRIEVASVPSGTTADICVGLFSNVSGEIKNLKITSNINVTVGMYKDQKSEGTIAGKLSGIISNCSVSTNTYASTTYVQYLGGIVGKATNGKIVNCQVNGEIVAKNTNTNNKGDNVTYVSGICGYSHDAEKSVEISKCFNNAEITATQLNNASNALYASGICYGGDNTIISNCYNTKTINSPYTGCGISLYAIINNCYNSGNVFGSNKYAVSNEAVTNCFYLSGIGTSITGATSLTDSQMKTQSMWVGFDFDNTWVLDPYANHPYPQLKDNIQDLNQSVKELSILSYPVKYEYLTGEELDLTGMMVEATYVSGVTEIINVTPDMISGFDNTAVGKQTVIITKDDGTESFEINVSKAPEVTGITLLTKPNKTEFAVGSAFDFTGATVQVNYNDGSKATLPVTAQMTTGGNIKKLGNQTITVHVGDFTTTFEVIVTTLQVADLKIVSLPNKTEYIEGQALDTTGLKLKAIFNSGKELEMTEGFEISGYEPTVGTHTVKASYNGFDVTFDVTVKAKTVLSLELKSAPTKLNYYEGQQFDKTGIVLVAKFDTGETTVVEDYTVTGFESTPGIHTVVLNYGGKQVSLTVTVAVKVMTEYTILSNPTKLVYMEGDDLDVTGLVVEAKYNDGTVKEITDYNLVGYSKAPGMHTVSVVYNGNVATFEVEVIAKTLIDIGITYPKKLSYYVGEAFDATGLTVTAYYDNGWNYLVEDYTVTGFDGTEVGTQTIYVTYGGITKTFAVSVSKHESITTNGTFNVGSMMAHLGDTITVPVTVKQNPGVAGFKHVIKFNASNLQYKSVTLGTAFANGTLIVTDTKKASGEIVVLWVGGKDVTASDVAYNIEFTVLETATAGNSEIAISFGADDNGNDVGDSVAFSSLNGNIEIRDYWLGDLDGDRTYKMADLLLLAQYVSDPINVKLTEKQMKAANVNEDDAINIHDVILLKQWLLEAEI